MVGSLRHCLAAAVSALALLVAAPTIAADYDYTDFGDDPGIADGSEYFFDDIDYNHVTPNENVVLRGSFGAMTINGTEHVYAGSSGTQNLSLLTWQGWAPTASLDLKTKFPGNWTLRGHIDAAIGGDHTMTDYDWYGPYFVSYAPNAWTHQSVSPNTSLDWYLNGEIAVGRDLDVNDAFSVNLNGGLKYQDVQWTAVGGTFVYSVGGFRDTAGTIPDAPAVRYRQQLPEGFLGVDATVKDGPWNLEIGGKYGMALFATATDHHYMRTPPLLFIDHLDYAQDYGVTAKVGYDFGSHLGAFVEGSYSKLTSPHGDTDVYDDSTGALIVHEVGPAGGDLETASLKAGIKGSF